MILEIIGIISLIIFLVWIFSLINWLNESYKKIEDRNKLYFIIDKIITSEIGENNE